MDVGTYASIFTGGKAYYGNIKAGKEYEIMKADGSVHTIYKAEADIPTVINSDTFADKYQKTIFTQSEYFNIGQVANLIGYNGKNDIDVVLKDSSIWRVAGYSLVNSVKICDDAIVIVDDGAVLKIGDVEYGPGTYTKL